MNDFTASNGVRITIKTHDDGTYLVGKVDTIPGCDRGWTEATGSERGIEALREFFRAEEDERLGRVREGAYVIYPHPDGERIRIMSEVNGESWEYWRDSRSSPKRGPALIASVYFSSHPEPRPWHDAMPGEVWVLDVEDETPGVPYLANDSSLAVYFTRVGASESAMTYGRHFALITAGRRIWPEATS